MTNIPAPPPPPSRKLTGGPWLATFTQYRVMALYPSNMKMNSSNKQDVDSMLSQCMPNYNQPLQRGDRLETSVDVRLWRLMSILDVRSALDVRIWRLLTFAQHQIDFWCLLGCPLAVDRSRLFVLKVTYHPIYNMDNCVTNKSKLPLDGAQLFPYMGWLTIMWLSHESHDSPHMGHMIALTWVTW